jgi:ABC-type methionine transport system permease subunit
LGIARILSFVILFMLFSQFDKVVVARNWFLVAAVVPLGIGYLLHTIYSLQPKK